MTRTSILSLFAALLVTLLVPTAVGSPPLRLDLTSPYGDPLKAGTVQTVFWQTDAYKIHGALADTSYRADVVWWVDNTTCYGVPSQSLQTGTFMTDAHGNANLRFTYTTPVPAEMLGHVSGVRWIFDPLLNNHPIGAWTSCTTIDLR